MGLNEEDEGSNFAPSSLSPCCCRWWGFGHHQRNTNCRCQCNQLFVLCAKRTDTGNVVDYIWKGNVAVCKSARMHTGITSEQQKAILTERKVPAFALFCHHCRILHFYGHFIPFWAIFRLLQKFMSPFKFFGLCHSSKFYDTESFLDIF